ncbi:hypothetical protein AB0L57_04685 [Nocardia sp. NPDC052254]|uniref:hypothetical protein n=1 Tax=Nocardia sp. NPDC052254 TaxID=3155681 RepID=UPI0034142EB2
MTDSPQSGPGDTGEGGERRPASRSGAAPGTPGTAPPPPVPPAGGVPPVTPAAGPHGSPQVPGPSYGPPGSVPPGAYPPPQGTYPPPPGVNPPPPQGAYPPPQQGPYPPQQGGYPPQGAYPPPQDNWNAHNGGLPPQNGPGPGYDAAAAYAGAPGLEVGRALGFAWDRFRANLIPWIAITLVGFVAYLAVTVVVNVTHVNSLLPVLLIGLLAALVVWLLQAAMIRGALYETDGTPPDFQSFFTFANAGNVILTALLVFVAACIGAALCVLPAIIVGYLCMFSLHFVIDQDLDPFTAIKSSAQLVVSNFVPTLLLALTVAAMTLVATALCGIGLLIAGPLSAIAVTYSYRVLTGGLIA